MSQTTEAVNHEHGEALQSLRDRCKHLENMLNFMQRLLDERNATITDLQSQLEAVGAGGVEPLLSRPIEQQAKPLFYAVITANGGLHKKTSTYEKAVEKCQKYNEKFAPIFGDRFTPMKVVSICDHQQPAQQQAHTMTDYQVEQLAHRTCWRYLHNPDLAGGHVYTFNRHTLLEFVRALREGGAA